jgi:uncharacterized SAM-binding protein YcdF (DUF218 family)
MGPRIQPVSIDHSDFFSRQNLVRACWIGTLTWLILVPGLIPVRRYIATQKAPTPQAIFILGGDWKREEMAAKLAKYYPNLHIWVSTGEIPETTQKIFREAGIQENRLHLDFQASDTVTNFTTLVPIFKAQNINHVYLMTSDFHMPRAEAIATLILGSKGITFTPVTAPSDRPKEQKRRIWRDIGRSVLWIYTGWSGETLIQPK